MGESQLFAGRFPTYAYMHILRPFMRMNGVKAEQIDQFVTAVSAKKLSVREIEQLANGFFRGAESFRQEILKGNLALSLKQVKEAVADSQECSGFERVLLKDLELTLGVSDSSGALTIQAIHVAGLTGQSVGSNTPRVVVDVINRSDKEIHLGLEYYTDYGSILGGLFSPGASSEARVFKVRPNWRGQLEFPMVENRFVKGGTVDITLARCPGDRFDSASAEVLHKKQYAVMTVSQQERAIKLLKTLRTGNGPQQHDAAEALAKYGRSVVSAVAEMLQNDNLWAAHALRRIGRDADDAVPALMESLAKGGDGGLRAFSATALGQIGPAAVQAIPTLIEALQDDHWNTRELAADALGYLSTGDPECRAALTAILRDENERVRKAASGSLKRIRDKISRKTVAHVR